MYKIEAINDWQIWNKFLENLDYNTFLHSKGWFEFNKEYGHQIWKYGIYQNNKLVSVSLVIKIKAKRGSFLFIPHGPWILENFTENMKRWRDFLIKKCKQENCSFFRISPILLQNQEAEKLFIELGFMQSPTHMHAELTTVVDISKENKEILAAMRKTTRQMIKKAEKMHLNKEITVNYPTEITEEMHKVYQITSKRGQFVPFTKNYLQKEYEAFNKNSGAKLITINYKGEMLSWGMFIFDRDRAFYHQGANILHKKVPASYYSHWLGMQEAKSRGVKSYDFWGVSPVDSVSHPWAKISLFKRGFGGNDVALCHAKDYLVTLNYWLTWLIETFRAKKRGF